MMRDSDKPSFLTPQQDSAEPTGGRLSEEVRGAYERLLNWAMAHTELGLQLLRPESLADEQQARKQFQNSLAAGQEIIAACATLQGLRWPKTGLLGPRPHVTEPLALGLGEGQQPPVLGLAQQRPGQREGILPLSGSMRFGTDPVLGGHAGRSLRIPEDLAKRHHQLAPSRSYSKKKASF